jgi:O-antigen ligase
VTAAVVTAAPPVPARRTVLPRHWPLLGVFTLYPLWWAVGFANIAQPLCTLPLAFQLLRRRDLRVPRGFGLWLLFIVWTLLAASKLEKFSHYVAWSWRESLWVGSMIVFLYVYNAPRDRLPLAKVTNMLVALWGAVVVGGYLGLLLGDTRLWTPAQLVVPKSLADIEFIQNTISPRFAQVQDWLGYQLPRPAAPLTFTNEWGATLAVLTPVVIAAWPYLRGRRRRVVGTLAVASFVPMIVSANRGLWVTLLCTVVYTTVRLARRRDPRAARRLFAGGVVLTLIVLLTPLGDVVTGRFESDHSNEARLTLYTQAREQVETSPLLGFGSPRSNEDNPNYPPVGTHGSFWLVLFSYGIPGALVFVALLASLVLRTSSPPDRRLLWLHAVVVAGFVEIPFYDLIPVPIFAVAAAAALVLREQAALEPATP